MLCGGVNQIKPILLRGWVTAFFRVRYDMHYLEEKIMRFAGSVLLCCAVWGQVPEGCQPSSLNIPGAPYPCIYPDRRVAFRVAAPDAQKVQVRLGGLTK